MPGAWPRSFTARMEPNPILLVTQYDGGRFSGWQRQPASRTVQGEMERVLQRLAGGVHVNAVAAGRTDAGVHAHGQAVGVRMPGNWTPDRLRKALNSLLPSDLWIRDAHEMEPDFHPRYSATERRYGYLVGTDDLARSPFRCRYEWALTCHLDSEALQSEADALHGEHTFRAFAVANTAPANDHHRCTIHHARWVPRDGGWIFEVSANRFLHHMVRFLVGTMIEVARGKRPRGAIAKLLTESTNAYTAPPAPAHGLSLLEVKYPEHLYAGHR